MRPFRFRAQAALQLRRREHERALAHLAGCERALQAAQELTEAADRAVRETEQRLSSAMTTPTSQHELEWYRSWRERCRDERGRCEEQRSLRAAEARLAEQAASAAYQRVRSLERLHDRALTAWRQAADREEMKTMDALAVTRFARREEHE